MDAKQFSQTQYRYKKILLIGPKNILSKSPSLTLNIDGSSVHPTPVVKNLGILLDSKLALILTSNHSLRLPSFTSTTLPASNPSSLLVMHTLWLTASLCPAKTTATPFSLVSLLNHFKGYNIFKTQQPGSSPIPDYQHTSHPFSTNSTGNQFCPISNSRYNYSPSKVNLQPCSPLHPRPPHPVHSISLTQIL